MRFGLRTAVVILATLVAAETTGAKPGFHGDVCTTVPTKDVTALGVSAHCTNAGPTPGPGSTTYVGSWAAAAPGGATLQVTIAVYSDKGVLLLATHNLKHGLPGRPKTVTGIGAPAYAAKGAMSVGLHLAIGDDIVDLSLNAIKSPPKSASVLKPLGKVIAEEM